MALTSTSRVILERRLARLQRKKGSPLAGLMGMGCAGLLVAPFAVLLAGFLGVVFIYGSLAGELRQGLGKIQNLDQRETFQTTKIVDRNGTLLRQVFVQGRRTYIPLAEMPKMLRDATIAVEDKSFYTNSGVDAQAILRAVWNTLRRRPLAGGASTISQQFVRHVAFSDKERMARSYTRKFKEMVLAVILNRQNSKDQILEWYLNEIYYGNLAYGIEAAAQTIFGKSAKDLDTAEASILVGLPQSPLYYDPLDPDPDVQARVKERQNEVLGLMVRNKVLTQAEADAAAAEKLNYKVLDDGIFFAPHFVVYVQNVLQQMDSVGAERLAKGGLTITTTLDLRLQDVGQAVVKDQVAKLKKNKLSNSALVAMEPRTGQILAMVGSADYWDDAIDGRVNVAIRDRQPGSSIKPITYVAALEHGIPASTLLWDVPMKLPIPGGIYEPKNYDDKFHGPVRMRTALANSYNIPALKVLALVGIDNMLDTAHKMGINGLQKGAGFYGLSVTLGGGEVTLLDMTTAFSTLANSGSLISPHPILKITDSDGNVVYDLKKDVPALTPKRAVDPRAAYIVTNILSDNAARTPAFGSNSPLALGVPAAVKTGTTNDYRDNWTVGFTPYLTVGVWAGNSDNSAMIRSSGVTGAAPIWNAFFRKVLADAALKQLVKGARTEFGFEAKTDFQRPKGVVDGSVCQLDSLRELSSDCQKYQKELFLSDEGPPKEDYWRRVISAVVPLPPPEPPPEAAPDENAAPKGPTALLCLAGEGGFGADKIQPVAVLPLPEDAKERQFVLEWAQKSGWPALEPTEFCTPEMVEAALPAGALAAEGFLTATLHAGSTGEGETVKAVYRLNLSSGTLITGPTPLTGTAMFDLGEVEYYKIELGAGIRPTEWRTIGDIHKNTVVGGPLEVLNGDALPAGDYIVRLVLVKKDGNFVQPTYDVPIRIGSPAGGQ